MKIYHTVPSEEVELQKIICDCCKKEFFYPEDELEIQEFLYIEKRNGYGSVFDDNTLLLCDICQHCTKKLLEIFQEYITKMT